MEARVIAEHDVADLFGLKAVLVRKLPGYVCPKDGEVLLRGDVVDLLHRELVRSMLTENFALGGYEIRFLRKALRLTQQRLADLLAVDRVTVARWEQELETVVGGPTTIAIRTVLSSTEGNASVRPPATAYREPPLPHPTRFVLDASAPASG